MSISDTTGRRHTNTAESDGLAGTQQLIGTLLIAVSIAMFCLLLAIWPSRQSLSARSLSDATLALAATEQLLVGAASERDRVEKLIEQKGKAVAANATEASRAQAAKQQEALQAELIASNSAVSALADRKAVEEAAVEVARVNLSTRRSDAVLLTQWGWLDRLLGNNSELRLLILVIVCAALGSMIHAARSFAGFTGRNTYDHSWNWWYFLRVPTGVGIALLFYFVIRGGFFAAGSIDGASAAETVNPFGIAAMSAVAGMFSRQTSDKVEEIFLNMFRTNSRSAAGQPVPVVLSISELRQGATGEALKLVVKGKNFLKDIKVFAPDNSERPVAYADSTRFTVTLDPSDAVGPLPIEFKFWNSPPHGEFVYRSIPLAIPSPLTSPV